MVLKSFNPLREYPPLRPEAIAKVRNGFNPLREYPPLRHLIRNTPRAGIQRFQSTQRVSPSETIMCGFGIRILALVSIHSESIPL